MEKPVENSLKEKLVEWLVPRFEKFESLIVFAALVTVLIKELASAQVGPLLIVFLGTLAYGPLQEFESVS